MIVKATEVLFMRKLVTLMADCSHIILHKPQHVFVKQLEEIVAKYW